MPLGMAIGRMSKRTYVGRVTKLCETCGASVTRKNSQFREHVFCSRKCHFTSEWFSEIRRVSNVSRSARDTRPCEQCGRMINRPVSQFNKRVFCDAACLRTYTLANPVRQILGSGYVLVFVGRDYPGATGSGHVLEHRKVMQDHLDRPLLPEENVHHKNGDRADNRLANLELWSRSQPSGQRVEDKIRWARNFLTLYDAM